MSEISKVIRVFLIDCSLAMDKDDPYRRRLDVHVPPLAMMMLASNLKQSDLGRKTAVAVADAAVDWGSLDELTDALKEFRPDLVGLRCLSIHTETLKACAYIAKGLESRPLVIAGGPHISSVQRAAFDEFSSVDMIAIGEGEDTLYEVVSALYYSKDPTDVPGTMSRTVGGVKAAPRRKLIRDLDRLAVTDWRLTDFSKYQSFMTGFAPVMRPCATIMTTRGCPYRCVYCHQNHGKIYRKRSIEHVLRELEELHDLGVREVNIVDDNFNLDNRRAIALFEEIAKRNWKMRFYFGNGVRGDRLPTEVLDAMIGGGTIYMVYALESGSERIQKYIKKGLNLERFEKSIRYALKTGIMVEMFTMVGFPTETAEEIQRTVDFATQFEELYMIYLNIVNVFPGTELFDMAIEAGLTREALLSQDRSQGYMGGVIDQAAVNNVKIELGWYLMQEDRLKKVIEKQRKFLTEKEIEALHRSWWGPHFRIFSSWFEDKNHSFHEKALIRQ